MYVVYHVKLKRTKTEIHLFADNTSANIYFMLLQ